LIDDQVTQLTGVTMSVIWETQPLAVFTPEGMAGMEMKADVEVAFDAFLRRTRGLRSRLGTLVDSCNDTGISFAKFMTLPDDSGRLLPTFDEVSALDVVVPVVTRKLADADRICHISRYTTREFKSAGWAGGWSLDAVEKVLGYYRTPKSERAVLTPGPADRPYGGSGSDSDDWGEDRGRFIGSVLGDSGDGDLIEVLEVYHWRDGEEPSEPPRRWRITFPACNPEWVLREDAWRWPGYAVTENVVDPASGAVVSSTTEITGDDDRPWPFVQFRFEDRSQEVYDCRGASRKLRTDQNEACAYRTAKAVMVDYTCKPFVKGGTKPPATFKWRPGDWLGPDGQEIVTNANISPIFDYSTDMLRAIASRRVGSAGGSLSSADKSKDSRTATEVKTLVSVTGTLSRDQLERFCEPLADLFKMMWEWLRRNPVDLFAVQADNSIKPVPEAVYQLPWTITVGATSYTEHSSMVAQRIRSIAEMMKAVPQAGQFIRGDRLALLLTKMIDPRVSKDIVVDPTQAGPGGSAPIEQQVAMMGQQLGAVTQYLGAIAQGDAGGPVGPGAGGVTGQPAQVGVAQ